MNVRCALREFCDVRKIILSLNWRPRKVLQSTSERLIHYITLLFIYTYTATTITKFANELEISCSWIIAIPGHNNIKNKIHKKLKLAMALASRMDFWTIAGSLNFKLYSELMMMIALYLCIHSRQTFSFLNLDEVNKIHNFYSHTSLRLVIKFESADVGESAKKKLFLSTTRFFKI